MFVVKDFLSSFEVPDWSGLTCEIIVYTEVFLSVMKIHFHFHLCEGKNRSVTNHK